MTNPESTIPSNPRLPRTSRRGRRQPQRNPIKVEIETANQQPNEDFLKNYIKPSEHDWPQWTHPRTEALYTLDLKRSSDISTVDLDACFNLIDETSGEAYRSSSVGWHVSLKKEEMRSPDLRYILIKDREGVVKGFTSMMPTIENSDPVVYCFEIHLKPELQGTGLGSQLMGYLMETAENIPRVEKVMLTCFVSNASGLRFYEKLGFDKDDFSPRERKLRGGKTVKPDYVILSRRTAAGREEAIDEEEERH